MKIHTQQGAILLVSLVMVAIMTLLTLAAFNTSLLELRISANMAASAKAFAEAEELLAATEKTIGQNVALDDRYSVKYLGCFALPGQPSDSCVTAAPLNAFVFIYEVRVFFTDPAGNTRTLRSYVSTSIGPSSSPILIPVTMNPPPLTRLAWIDL